MSDSWFLKKICTIFGDNLPRGCTKPFTCNGTEYTNENHIGLAVFECPESYKFDVRLEMKNSSPHYPPTSPTITTTTFTSPPDLYN